MEKTLHVLLVACCQRENNMMCRRAAQYDDFELQRLIDKRCASQKSEKVPMAGTNVYLYCDTQGWPRPFITNEYRRRIFNTVHGMIHPGTRSTIKVITVFFILFGNSRNSRYQLRVEIIR